MASTSESLGYNVFSPWLSTKHNVCILFATTSTLDFEALLKFRLKRNEKVVNSTPRKKSLWTGVFKRMFSLNFLALKFAAQNVSPI